VIPSNLAGPDGVVFPIYVPSRKTDAPEGEEAISSVPVRGRKLAAMEWSSRTLVNV
jgi:hypothetical protein